jgi:predicted RNA-binding Zn ribbon-like protein
MNATPSPHAHEADLNVFLDLVNSLEFEDGVPRDHLATASDAADFLARRNLAHRDALMDASGDERAGARHLARFRDVRSAAREAWDAIVEHRAPDPQAVERLNQALRHRPVIELTAGAGGFGIGHRHAGDPWDEALARAIEPFVDSVARGDADRYRVCANDGCRWIFYDESRAGRRRWCSMSSCGNRAKAARHRARKREEAPETLRTS